MSDDTQDFLSKNGLDDPRKADSLLEFVDALYPLLRAKLLGHHTQELNAEFLAEVQVWLDPYCALFKGAWFEDVVLTLQPSENEEDSQSLADALRLDIRGIRREEDRPSSWKLRGESPWEVPVYKSTCPADRLLLVSNGKVAKVLDYIGPALAYWFDCVGDYSAFDGIPAGIWIWEGGIDTGECWTDYGLEYDAELDGSHRALTPEEWESWVINDCPWDESEWLLPSRETYPIVKPAVTTMLKGLGFSEIGSPSPEIHEAGILLQRFKTTEEA